MLVAAVDVWPAIELHPVWWQPPPIYDTMKGQQVVLAEFPTSLNISYVNNAVPFMYFSIWHGLPMINGYSGFTPPGYELLMEGLRDFPGAGDDRSAEVERCNSRDSQLCALRDRLRADPGGDRRLARAARSCQRPLGRAASQALRARPVNAEMPVSGVWFAGEMF